MKNSKTDFEKSELKIKKAFSAATPDVLGSILSDCESQKEKVIYMNQSKHVNKFVKMAASIAAAVVIVLAGTASYFVYSANYKVSSTISLDVNPSIEITVNSKEKVLKVLPLNADAEKVVGNMDFSGSDLDITVNALIGSMLRNGYLNELSNSILISVDTKDETEGAELREKLTAEINAILSSDTFDGAVITQNITSDKQLQTLADTYGITPGKAQLVSRIVSSNELYSFEELSKLSINELNLLSATGTLADSSDNIDSTGKASTKAYIGEDKALETALNHANVDKSSALQIKTELDFEDGTMVYEVEFKYNGYEYDYEINATTGDIIKSGKEYDDDYNYNGNTTKPGNTNSGNSNTTNNYITQDTAKATALNHAGVKESDVQFVKNEFDYDDGRAVYDIDFKYGGYEYDYEIDASTGAIIKSEKEFDDDYRPTGSASGNSGNSTSGNTVSGNSGSANNYITQDTAKATALNHAGVKESDVQFVKNEFDYDDGRAVYDIDFKYGGYEYDYEIDASTGAIIKSEKDIDDDYRPTGSTSGNSGSANNYITQDTAKATALNHAGVKESDVLFVKNEFDYDDGRAVYDIDFKYGGYEYDYEIDASTGAIIKSEKEFDDDYRPIGSTSGNSGNSTSGNTASGNSGSANNYITQETAKATALNHAGVKESDVQFVKNEFDRDDGKAVYEIEFKHGAYEYEYEIDALTGEVIKSEKDIDD